MSNEIIPVAMTTVTCEPIHTDDIASAFLAGRNDNTMRAYSASLQKFADHLGVETGKEAMTRLLSMPQGNANMTVLGYRNAMYDAGLAPATVQSRIAAINSAVKIARMVGAVSWSLDVPAVKVQAMKDTRGCGLDGFKSILAQVEGDTPLAQRDRAIIRLMFDLALRRGTVASLDIADLDIEKSALWTLPKGGNKVLRHLPATTRDVLIPWLEVRPDECPALFVNLDRAYKTARLSGTSIYNLVVRYGKKAGLTVWPHQFRHAAGTLALEKSNGNIRKVQKFMGHANPRTTMIYDDNRLDVDGEISAMVAGA